MRSKDLGALLLLGALWGGSFFFIRVAVPALGPALLMEVRVFIAAVTLGAYTFAVGRLGGILPRWKEFLLLGGLNAALPFTLIAAAEINLTASFAAILNATTPLFAAIVAVVWIGEALTLKRVVGLVMGIFGVALIVGWTPISLNAIVLLSVGASLAAAFSYSLGGVYAKRTFPDTPPLTLAIGQQAGAATVLLPLAAASLPQEPPPLTAILCVLALALLSTALAYLLYFRLISSVGPTRTLTVTFLVPVFGVFFGVLLLAEPVTLSMVLGLGIVLLSVGLVTGIRLGKAK